MRYYFTDYADASIASEMLEDDGIPHQLDGLQLTVDDLFDTEVENCLYVACIQYTTKPIVSVFVIDGIENFTDAVGYLNATGIEYEEDEDNSVIAVSTIDSYELKSYLEVNGVDFSAYQRAA